MKISKITIKDYNQFKNFTIDLTYPTGHSKAGEPLEKVIPKGAIVEASCQKCLSCRYFTGVHGRLCAISKQYVIIVAQ